ncbi:unnamed protein product [Amoebophrya sp. A25]|nr:unnamed protein product [Amoebophrya sp. A25]|eukprot:GSA25T00019831001.1
MSSSASGSTGDTSMLLKNGGKKLHELRVVNSLLKSLRTDPEQGAVPPNRARAVKKGHFVPARGEPLEKPYFICGSRSFAQEIGLDTAEFEQSDAFKKIFTADSSAIPSNWDQPWATSYGVSVHGYWATNSPFGVFGYGDGRAMSIVEVPGSRIAPKKHLLKEGDKAGPSGIPPPEQHTGLILSERHWELQLKGSGRTAYSRHADGRAVLRSSIREFLTSEAFHHLGVPATRALSLFGSKGPDGTTCTRAWYPGSDSSSNQQMMSEEPCAITCRASPSFLRVGQIELFARTRPLEELQQIVRYALLRDFAEEIEEVFAVLVQHDMVVTAEAASKVPLTVEVVARMAEIFAERQAFLHCEWLRVGYIQGNMNNDNALLCGRTMDFGPFGMLEEFNPKQQIWEGDMEGKFAYANQPLAGQVILMTLCQSLLALFQNDEGMQDRLINSHLKPLLESYDARWKQIHYNRNCRRKLGLQSWNAEALGAFRKLEVILAKDKLDFIHFFRSLAKLAEESGQESGLFVRSGGTSKPDKDVELSRIFANAIFDPKRGENGTKSSLSTPCYEWLTEDWPKLVAKLNEGKDGNPPLPDVAMMKQTSPAIIPRNWMMVKAYEAAEKGDLSIVRELHALFEDPYRDDITCKWNRASPLWQYGKAGVRIMS